MMQRPIIEIPRGFLNHLNMDWDIDWRGQPGSETTGGNTRTVYNAFPRWVGTPEITLYRDEIREWRALRARARGRVGIYAIPICDPVADTTAGLFPSGIPWDGGVSFSDGTNWAYDPFILAVRDQSPGNNILRVDFGPLGIAPIAGQIFSHDDWPFVVKSMSSVSGDIYDLEVQPPLRASIAAGDRINVRARGRFEAVEDTMGNPAYQASRHTRIRLQFREVLTR